MARPTVERKLIQDLNANERPTGIARRALAVAGLLNNNAGTPAGRKTLSTQMPGRDQLRVRSVKTIASKVLRGSCNWRRSRSIATGNYWAAPIDWAAGIRSIRGRMWERTMPHASLCERTVLRLAEMILSRVEIRNSCEEGRSDEAIKLGRNVLREHLAPLLLVAGEETRLKTAECSISLPPLPRNDADSPFHSLYRGMGPPLVGVTPIFAISFWVRLALLARHIANAVALSPRFASLVLRATTSANASSTPRPRTAHPKP